MSNPSDNASFRRATIVAIGALTLVMLLSTFVFYRQNAAILSARNWVNHTYEVKEHIQNLRRLAANVGFSERGYLLTGDESILEPYDAALAPLNEGPNREEVTPLSHAASSISETDFLDRLKKDGVSQHYSMAEEIAILRNLTADNPTQQQNIADVEREVNKFLAHTSEAIAARRKQEDFQTLPKVDVRDGSERLERISNLLSTMTSEENHLLILRTQLDEAGTRESRFLTFMGVGLFYILMVLAVWLYQRMRQKAQTELMRYTQQLERSEEELKMQQEELKASNEEIEASNEELEEQNAQIRQQSIELAQSKQLIEDKATEVQRASKYKSEFLANMSHELRTPLNSLLILARSLASNEDGNLTTEQIEEAQIIHNDGLELLNLINDILDLSKVEAGKFNIIAEDTSLDDIIKRLQQLFGPIAKQADVAFPVELDADLPPVLHTDAQRVEQILKNMLSNAFKFTSRGSVTLKIHRPDNKIELLRTSLEHKNAIAFSVRDTGIGIEASKLKDIFEAFQQEDGSTERHYGGTGLGLTIARKFAHLLGGEVHVSSEKGKGSIFTLVLPINFVSQVTTGESSDALGDISRPATILKTMPRTSLAEFISDDRRNISEKDKVLLIIEDDKNFASILMKIARKKGYKCLVAGDGKSGLLLALEEPVTAIILDLKLPDIEGLQVLDQLKSDLRSRHIPVHIISGRDESQTVVSLRKGAIGYLMKPVPEEGIDRAFAKIETLLKASMKQILVVEDDKRNQTAIQTLLRKNDVNLVFSDTGIAALEQLKIITFDCIILDLRLPDMTGFEWLEWAEKGANSADLPPIIIYTAKDLNEEENLRLSRYTNSIIIKGAKSPERLLDEVTLFLHSVESTLSEDQREMIRMQHDPDKALQGRTVLLVDDDLRNTFALSKVLKKHGVKVIIADNGQMALDKIKEVSLIDLIIMDIMMPVMDGYQAMREIRNNKEYASIPIIALTARAMPDEQEKCMEAGANDYLTKPVDVERLLTLMRVWLFRQEMAA